MTPELTVVMPTIGRPHLVERALESLRGQTCADSSFEIVVALDGPDDATRAVLSAAPNPNLRVVEQPRLGATSTLNAGARSARGRILLFLDDDMVASPTLVAAHLAAHREQDGVVVIGFIGLEGIEHADPFTRYFGETFLRRYRQFDAGTREVTARDAYSGNISVTRDAFEAVGGFQEGLSRGYDVELAHRLEEHGARFVYVREAASTETSERNFRVTAAHFLRAGRTAWSMYEDRPGLLQTNELGLPWEPKPLAVLAFRATLAVRPPLAILALVDRVIGGRARGRWHAPLARHLYWRGVRKTVPEGDTWRRLLYGTPILMYHAIGEPGERASRYIIPARTFRRQLRYLARRGYRVIALDEYVALRRANRLPPYKSVVITLDDGYRDNCTVAAPALAAQGFPATFFVISERIGASNDWSVGDALVGRPLAGLEALAEAAAGGITISGHTRTHPRLTQVPPERAAAEIQGSKTDLEERFGRPVEAFAYPYGDYDAGHERLVAEAGYTSASSVRPGLNRARTPLYALRRAEIRGGDTLFRLALALWFGDPNAVLSRRRRRRRN